MSRCLVIINPVSGGGAARRYALDLQWKLSTLFETIEVKFTTGEGDATRFAKDACERGFDAVFCMGGDGTVNETVNGIAQGGFKSTFGFIPVGTVNDMSRALGIHQNPAQAIKRIDINETRTIDIGRCNDKYFCNNIAAGVIPKVVEEVTPKEKAYSALSPTSCAQAKRYLPLKTIHTASKRRTTTLSVNPLSF